MLALTLIQLCAREVNDVGYERIARDSGSATLTNGPNWLDLLNDAQRAIVLARPDAGSSVENISLAAGTRQALPSGAIRLLNVTRNMGSNGTTVGKVVMFAKHEDMDGISDDWYTTTAATPVDQVIYDDKKSPLVFFIDPPRPANTAWYIEVVLSRSPTDVAVNDVTTGAINVPDIYAGPMQAWMLHRNYAMATQSAAQFQRAQFYFQSFFNQLGVKLKGEMFGGVASSAMLPSTGGKDG